MKKKPLKAWSLSTVIIVLVAVIYFQLFKQPTLVEGNDIRLIKTYTHHTNEVWEVKFGPNDSLMISGGLEKNAKIWNRITGEVLHDLPHEYGTPSVDFSPNGKTVCTGSYDGKARVWDAQTGNLIRVLEGNEGTLWSITYSPNGKLIAAGGNDDKVSVWSVETGELMYEFKDASHNIWEVIFHPSGELLLASGSDNAIRVYNMQSGKLVKTILGHSKVPLSMDFSLMESF